MLFETPSSSIGKVDEVEDDKKIGDVQFEPEDGNFHFHFLSAQPFR